MDVPGLHHVTAITADPQKNIDFYTGVLGLRLVKLTVNFDDPRAYHLYYGDTAGSPGTTLTFFAWPNAHKGQSGSGEVSTISFGVPDASIAFWEERLAKSSLPYEKYILFDRTRLSFADPDGIALELVGESEPVSSRPWVRGAFDLQNAIRGFHGVTLRQENVELTRKLLLETFGYREVNQTDMLYAFESENRGIGSSLIIRVAPDLTRAISGAGSVHHIAFRARSDNDEIALRDAVLSSGINATPVIDRMYFHSVYFHEPGGVLFEIATDLPGFTIDEPLELLGTSLRLPPQYESHRAAIVQALPSLTLPV